MIGGGEENALIHFTYPYFITQFPPPHIPHTVLSAAVQIVLDITAPMKDSSFLVLSAISVSALLDDELNVADSYLVVDDGDGEVVVLRMRSTLISTGARQSEL